MSTFINYILIHTKISRIGNGLLWAAAKTGDVADVEGLVRSVCDKAVQKNSETHIPFQKQQGWDATSTIAIRNNLVTLH